MHLRLKTKVLALLAGLVPLTKWQGIRTGKRRRQICLANGASGAEQLGAEGNSIARTYKDSFGSNLDIRLNAKRTTADTIFNEVLVHYSPCAFSIGKSTLVAFASH